MTTDKQLRISKVIVHSDLCLMVSATSLNKTMYHITPTPGQSRAKYAIKVGSLRYLTFDRCDQAL